MAVAATLIASAEPECNVNLRPYKGIVPRVAASAYVDPAAIVIGDVEIGDDASVWPCAVIRGDVNHVRIGARTNVQDGAVLHVAHRGRYSPGYPLLIGSDVTIGHAAVVHACTIGDSCLIGINATILDGAIIGRHCLIGAGAVVGPGKRVGDGELWVGNPARFVRVLSAGEIERLDYSARQYVGMKNDYVGG